MRELREAKEKAEGKPPKPQEPPPILFPDLHWVWAAYCFLSDRRGVGANGPLPITVEAMEAYLRMSNRYESPYVEQVIQFVPALDREYLHDFYEKQRKEMDKQKRKTEQGANRRTGQPSLGKRR
jgi:hypothetical protein